MAEEVLRLCCKHLMRYSHLERQWLWRLEAGQAAVCSALNREAPRARLASEDFCGQGFTPRDAVSGWLGVRLA